MVKFIVDSSAWIEYLGGTPKGSKLQKYFDGGELFTTGVCVAEVVAKVLREGLSAEIALDAIRSLSKIIPVDYALGSDGGKLYVSLRSSRPKIALADALSVSAARRLSAKVLTFDKDFSGLPEAIVL